MPRRKLALALLAATAAYPALAQTTPYFRFQHDQYGASPGGLSGTSPSAQSFAVSQPAPVTSSSRTAMSVPPPQTSNAGGTPTWGLLAGGSDVSNTFGSLCPGLGFSTASGTISGTPTASCSVTLSYVAYDPGNATTPASSATSAPFAFSVSVPSTPSVSLSPPSTAVTPGTPVQLSASTNIPGPTWTVSGNPSWMTFAPSGTDYVASGSPPPTGQAQTYPVALTATGGGSSASATAYVTVEPNAASMQSGLMARSAKSFSIPLSDAAFQSGSWAVRSSPADFPALSISAGSMTGTAPTITGTATATRSLTATGPSGQTVPGTFTVYPPLAVKPASTTISGTLYQPMPTPPAVNATGTMGTLTYSTSSTMPSGLTIDPATGYVVGTPQTFGTWPIVLSAQDSWDNAVGTVNETIQISGIQDISFYDHNTSTSFFYDFGNPGKGSAPVAIQVVIQNATQGDLFLSGVSASADGDDPDAFILASAAYPGAASGSTPGTPVATYHSYDPSGTSSAGSPSPSSPVEACQGTLHSKYYCGFYLQFAPSSVGPKTGYLTVLTQAPNNTAVNNVSKIPLRGAGSGFIPAGSMLVTQSGKYNLGASRQVSFRFAAIGSGDGRNNNTPSGGGSGVLGYGDMTTDQSGNVNVTVGGATTGAQVYANGAPPYIGKTVLSGNYTFSATGAYTISGTQYSLSYGGGSGTSGSLNGADGTSGYRNPNGLIYSHPAGSADPRFGYPANGPVTSSFKLATIAYAPGGKGGSPGFVCGQNNIAGSGGGGGGVNVLLGAPGGPQTMAAVPSPAGDGWVGYHGLQGKGGQGFGAGAGGADATGVYCNGVAPPSSASNAPTNTGGRGMVYIEWDVQ